ncbi:DUF2242 domain-containing protein [Comamonas faecalis]|uniref:DUF2242 domain-containing protein n=1 Tax=Comamonas faecalis TaxID=1387849 RepID=A0ABP7RWB7_9BURK
MDPVFHPRQRPAQGRRWLVLLLPALCLPVLLAGCARLPEAMPGLERAVAFTPDDFDSAGMHTRLVDASQEQTCEAARRALLSQGYQLHQTDRNQVAGRKFYQPHTDVHYEVEMRVVCAPDNPDDTRASVYASALQDRYVIKKINNSASLGVGAIGSLSLPVTASDDTLVKVGSETISDARYYERFFALFSQYVHVLPQGTASARLTAARAARTPLPEREAVPHAVSAQLQRAQPEPLPGGDLAAQSEGQDVVSDDAAASAPAESTQPVQ